eukprot:2559674-Rhodomonas_salina.3
MPTGWVLLAEYTARGCGDMLEHVYAYFVPPEPDEAVGEPEFGVQGIEVLVSQEALPYGESLLV